MGGRRLWVDRQCEVSRQSLEFFEVGTTENDVQVIVREPARSWSSGSVLSKSPCGPAM